MGGRMSKADGRGGRTLCRFRTPVPVAGALRPRYSTRMNAAGELEIRRRKLLFRAQRRGFREVDLMFGAFVDAHLGRLSEAELDRFEALLAVPDWQIYGWLMGHEPVPAAFDDAVFARLRAYRENLAPSS
jgi:antitoxin CptB